MLRWLLNIGIDIHQTDDHGGTALSEAAEYDNAEAIIILLQAGADVDQNAGSGTALGNADTRDVALRLLEAGADPQKLTSEARRSILGYPQYADEDLLNVTKEEFLRHSSIRFGSQNPEDMTNPFWEGMVRSGLGAHGVGARAPVNREYGDGFRKIWCAERNGQSITFLPDGRIVQVAGEHEDGNDADFCIYNDVFVHDPDGTLTIYGYPAAVFPPTDFHTATLVGEDIYLIGSLGYLGQRAFGKTPIYRLSTRTFQMERLKTTGDNPGWIYNHRAVLTGSHEITVTGGTVLATENGKQIDLENTDTYILNLDTLVWRVKAEEAGD